MFQSDTARRPTEVAKEAARLARKVLGHEVEVIWFGSWPLGRAQARSDIDLAMACRRANSSGADDCPARSGGQFPDPLRDRPGRPGFCWPVAENRNSPSRCEAMSPRLESLRKAIDMFRAALEAFETDISRDAAIQRFEFCFELAWKSIQERARDEGLDCQSPKGCFLPSRLVGLWTRMAGWPW